VPLDKTVKRRQYHLDYYHAHIVKRREQRLRSKMRCRVEREFRRMKWSLAQWKYRARAMGIDV
jgi:hypothetical protein